MCTCPNSSQRPETPLRYADEVWTGIEYQVAAHCFWEGFDELGWQVARAVWNRHDGSRRNPYNEIEAGDHYARAMAGWSVLEALAGYRHDASVDAFEFRSPVDGESYAFVASEGWGRLIDAGANVTLECGGGMLSVRRLVVGGDALVDGDAPLIVRPGAPLVVERARMVAHAD